MWLPSSVSVWLYRQPIDFRKQIDGLALLVADALEQNPTSGQVFVFRNRRGDKVKILFWQENGFWLLYKRNEQGRFIFPALEASTMELTMAQLQWLLSGWDFRAHQPLPQVQAAHFF